MSPDGFASNSRLVDSAADVVMTSVGVDIGSTTTHFVLSRIRLGLVSGRYVPLAFHIVQESGIRLTPYDSAGLIDPDTLEDWIEQQYVAAGIRIEDVDTGVVLLTGNALSSANSRAIAELFAGAAGTFVSVAAGHEMESALAARGSGALNLSRREQIRILHIDIGGGTTKYAICDAGTLIATAAIDVGARLIEVDEGGRVVRLHDRGKQIAQSLGFDIAVGSLIGVEGRRCIATKIADLALDILSPDGPGSDHLSALLTDALPRLGNIDAVTFSGGVSEYIHGREVTDFGDLGIGIGEAIRQRMASMLAAHGVAVRELRVGIRATVMGASRHTLQLSGETVVVLPPEILPLRNVPVVAFPLDSMGTDSSSVALADEVRYALKIRGLDGGESPVAFAIAWQGPATYDRIDAMCSALLQSTRRESGSRVPLVIVTNQDVGGLLGLHLAQVLGVSHVVSLDGLFVDDFDYLDLGTMVEGTGAVPVVVKSMLFAADDPESHRP